MVRNGGEFLGLYACWQPRKLSCLSDHAILRHCLNFEGQIELSYFSIQVADSLDLGLDEGAIRVADGIMPAVTVRWKRLPHVINPDDDL